MSKFWPVINAVQPYEVYNRGSIRYLRAEVLKLGVFPDLLDSENGFRGYLNTLKLYTKSANVFMRKRLIVFIKLSKGLIYF